MTPSYKPIITIDSRGIFFRCTALNLLREPFAKTVMFVARGTDKQIHLKFDSTGEGFKPNKKGYLSNPNIARMLMHEFKLKDTTSFELEECELNIYKLIRREKINQK